MFRNVLRQIRQIVYRLKRNFGVPITFIRLSNYQDDGDTGDMSQTKQNITIKRAILAPAKMIRDFVYDLSFIAANKNFTYGGYFDAGDRIMIIDAKDLPKGFEPNLNDYIIYDGVKYTLKEVHPVAENYAWLIVLKQVDAVPVPS